MNEYLAEALSQISEKHIGEAAAAKARRSKFWLGAVAAVLAVVIAVNIGFIPMAVPAKAVSVPSGSRSTAYPEADDYPDRAQYQAARKAWNTLRDQRNADYDAALTALMPFFRESTTLYMEGTEENRVWSPANAYIALGMLAEVTAGASRQQVLSVLNTPDLDTLRSQVGAVWESVYTDDGNEICRLANSLWLDQKLEYDQDTMDSLAYYHYASVYQTDLEKKQAAKALRAWLNNNTGGLLKDSVENAAFPPEAVMTLASTVYLQSKWTNEFNKANNTQGIFHGPNGGQDAVFMNKKGAQMTYYWFDSCGAVALGLKNGSRMWLILPDEGKTVDTVLREGQFWDLLMPAEEEPQNSKYVKVNLSMPKFDIRSSADLKDIFLELGISDIFDLQVSDFTAITADSPVAVTAVNQAARVVVDEDGVKAASYIEFPGAGAAMPPEEIIDFILDRPFLFIIADYSGIPLFTGVVNAP